MGGATGTAIDFDIHNITGNLSNIVYDDVTSATDYANPQAFDIHTMNGTATYYEHCSSGGAYLVEYRFPTFPEPYVYETFVVDCDYGCVPAGTYEDSNGNEHVMGKCASEAYNHR